MGEKDSWTDLLPEEFREALLSDPKMLRKLCRLGGYKDVEMLVDEVFKDIPALQGNSTSPNENSSSQQLLLESPGFKNTVFELTEKNSSGRQVTTRMEKRPQRKESSGGASVVITQEYQLGMGGEVPRLEISPSAGDIRTGIDLLFGTVSTIPDFFHAKYNVYGWLEWCSFIGSPIEKVFSEKGLSSQEEKEFMCCVPNSTNDILRVGIYIDTHVRKSRPATQNDLEDYRALRRLGEKPGEDVRFPDHSLYVAVKAGRLTFQHTNERSLTLDSPHFRADIPTRIDMKNINSLFTLEGLAFVDACIALPVYFNYPSLLIEMNLKRTLPK